MGIYFPFIGALALAAGTVVERLFLKRKKVNIKMHNCLEFLAITLVMLPFIYFFWQVSPEALQLKNLVIMGIVIFFAMIANLLVFYSIKGDKICNLEPARIMEPLFIVVLALFLNLFLDSELYKTSPKILYSALIAGTALIFSHIKKHHLKFNKYFLAATLGSFFFALEMIFSRFILNYYSGFSLYFIRCTALFILGIIFLRPKKEKPEKSYLYGMLGLGAIWTIYRIIIYYGYLSLGVVSTTLIFMLSPIFIYTFACIFLKEKPTWRNILASVVIILCVVYGEFF
jgi:drug/metabolite transporter (DMT)-like permease